MYKIIVATLYRIKTSVGLVVDWNYIKNSDIRRQGTVEFKQQFLHLHFYHVCMKKILTGVYSGVCSPAAVDRGGRFQDL